MEMKSKLGEELKKIQNIQRSLDLIATAYNQLLLAHEALAAKVAALEAKPKKAPLTSMTAKAMAAELGWTSDHEKIAALKFFARKHATENNLPISTGPSGPDHKSFERFPLESARWAMTQVGKK